MSSSFKPPDVSPDCYPQGFRGAGMYCGIKKSGKRDLALIVSECPCLGAGVFTQNRFAAAPVEVSRRAAADGSLSAVIINSGVANACTGPEGLKNAESMATMAAEAVKREPSEIAVCSTGVIGSQLHMPAIKKGVQILGGQLQPDAWSDVVDAIRTTDAFPKMAGANWQIAGKTVRLLGLCKGGGMIHPNMATMLAVLMTDCAVDLEALRAALKEAVGVSFNSITVDGDTSTNDTVLILANGRSDAPIIKAHTPEYETFRDHLADVCIQLGKLIVHDGEGATKIGVVTVTGASDDADARSAAMAVAKSPLVKTALYGSDANWGRIVCAIGYSGAEVNPDKCSVVLGGQTIFSNGLPVEVDEARAASDLEKNEVSIEIDLGTGGGGQATVYTSDLTHDYIQLNAFYRT